MITVDFDRSSPRSFNRSRIGSLMVITRSAKSMLAFSTRFSCRMRHESGDSAQVVGFGLREGGTPGEHIDAVSGSHQRFGFSPDPDINLVVILEEYANGFHRTI